VGYSSPFDFFSARAFDSSHIRDGRSCSSKAASIFLENFKFFFFKLNFLNSGTE